MAGGRPSLSNVAAYSSVNNINPIKGESQHSDEVLEQILCRLSILEQKICENINVSPVSNPSLPSVPSVITCNPRSDAPGHFSQPAGILQVRPFTPPTNRQQQPTYCYYHRRFGAQARHCTYPCSWAENGLGASSYLCGIPPPRCAF